MFVIDGSLGEGGGQVLRTALALSLVTGAPFRIERIRAGRQKPGLQRQHLTAVNAAAQISGAVVTGDAIGSQELVFAPGAVRPGEYRFAVGTAGSCTLVLQTVLPALLYATEPSSLVLEGGTHNPLAPPFDFLEKAFIPLVNRMGETVSVSLDRPGFYPAGGGRMRVSINRCRWPGWLDLPERGEVKKCCARALIARLPRHIAERELDTISRELGWPADCLRVEEVADSAGPGNAVILEIESEHVTEVFTGFGQRGVRAEDVASAAAREAREYLDAGVPVGPHLADQLLLPMAIAGGGRFRTLPLTPHATTNIEIIQRLIEVDVAVTPAPGGAVDVQMRRGPLEPIRA